MERVRISNLPDEFLKQERNDRRKYLEINSCILTVKSSHQLSEEKLSI